ncbi:hypothetical protein [Streptomyces graminilatus]|uniref:hypothetical protein n=1 Tax=Streptomyces graminilatus TaxID=1464070 RepID=UPI0006E20FE4|nr:hypothetical protein [Streptomyces graminilatus]
MRRARTRRRTAAIAMAMVSAAVPLLGGCGIRATDVVEAGGPAGFQASLDRDFDMLVFLRSPDGGVVPVIRTAVDPAADSTDDSAGFGYEYTGSGGKPSNLSNLTVAARTHEAVAALLAGPQQPDRAAGLTTSLPATAPTGTVKVTPASNGRVTTYLPLALAPLNNTALRQLTCTIAYSQDADGRIVVDLKGQDGKSNSGTCDLAPGNTGNTGTPGTHP